MHEPADIGGQLLSLRAWQEHAVVQRMQETALRDPAPPLHQLLVHDRDLSGWAAETDETELEPEQKSLEQTDRLGTWQILLYRRQCGLIHQRSLLSQMPRAGHRRWRKQRSAGGRH